MNRRRLIVCSQLRNLLGSPADHRSHVKSIRREARKLRIRINRQKRHSDAFLAALN